MEIEKTNGSKYMSGQLCQFLLKNVTEGESIKLATPFGEVSVTKRSENEAVHAGALASYESIIDSVEKSKEYSKDTIRVIYNYLSLLSDEKVRSIEQFQVTLIKDCSPAAYQGSSGVGGGKKQELNQLKGIRVGESEESFKDNEKRMSLLIKMFLMMKNLRNQDLYPEVFLTLILMMIQILRIKNKVALIVKKRKSYELSKMWIFYY
ncbi:MAG: hypothetical protein LBF33_02110 [Oscillospiraceae bacterium]|jgi:hypothetical protein|nr:hypothetical protein [Oscillospiraceae bacterium]